MSVFMSTEPPSTKARTGTPGLDVFKIAGESISGFLRSLKTGDQRLVRMPYTSTLEARLSLFCEYHPYVRTYQRGDMSPAFVSAYGIHAPLVIYILNFLIYALNNKAQQT
jgi:hypothetical protein